MCLLSTSADVSTNNLKVITFNIIFTGASTILFFMATLTWLQPLQGKLFSKKEEFCVDLDLFLDLN